MNIRILPNYGFAMIAIFNSHRSNDKRQSIL